jgi:hypothetical protein
MSGIEILLSDSRGVYIPKHFSENFILWDGVSDADREILESGPENELYWDVWDSVTRDATYTDSEGNVWRLHQDGDLFAYCEELMTDEEYYGFFGEHRSDLDREDRLETDNWYNTNAEV